ncbi:MAG: UDP-N-acetylglucosamine 2-epimerase [Planctomycetota bacterium]|nr:UDP-N-acetylglucosamine 2-epimerase [Planctomycetota bacterium]
MSAAPVRVAIITGSRADFGLLTPVIRAIDEHSDLAPLVVAGGAHLLPPARSIDEVRAQFEVAAEFEMQRAGDSSRLADAAALGRGIEALADVLGRLEPDWVVVLGDRIEAFAGACAASVGGAPLAHLHGGDVAEGVADESMRHAITKLAHLHLAATTAAAERIERMGESRERIEVVGSPAIDALADIPAMDTATAREFGDPDTLLLLHPIGDSPEVERRRAEGALEALRERRVLAMHPNHDPGREGILAAIEAAALPAAPHLPRPTFIGLLKRLAQSGGLMIGNSSAALIEAAALRLPAVDLGERQAGRERGGNVVHADGFEPQVIRDTLRAAMAIDRDAITHPFGAGDAGRRTAEEIAHRRFAGPGHRRAMIRKRLTY